MDEVRDEVVGGASGQRPAGHHERRGGCGGRAGGAKPPDGHLAGTALVTEDQRGGRRAPREPAVRLGASLQRAFERRADLLLAARDLREPEPLQGGV